MSILKWFGLYTKKQYLELSDKSSSLQKELAEAIFELNKNKDLLNGGVEEVVITDSEEVLLSEIAEFKDVSLLEHVETALKNNIVEEIKNDVEISKETTTEKVIVTGKLKYYKNLNK